MASEQQVDEIFDKFESDLQKALQIDGNMEWGSCQYDSAKATYDWALGLIRMIGLDKFEEVMKITHSPAYTKEEFTAKLHNYIKEVEAEYIEDGFYEDCDLKPYVFAEPYTIDQYFDFTRNVAWDLWSAFRFPFDDYKIGYSINTTNPSPLLLNAMTSGENFETGLACAYLTFLYGVSEECFKGYDT